MKIIITGSLGNISRPLAEALLLNGHQITVVSSNQGRREAIEALGAQAAIGSITDIGFLTTTFKGADAVYAMVPPNFTAPDPLAYYEQVGHAYAEAIRASGVRRVVQLSSWGAHLAQGTGVIVGSHRVEENFNQLQNVAVTFLRPCSFYNNLYHYIGMIKSAGFIATNFGGADKVVWVSPKDIAEAAAVEIVLAESKKVRYVASDERTCNEVAAVLGAAIGKPDLKWLKFSDTDVKAAMEKNGIPTPMAEKLVELNVAIRTGLMREDYDLHTPPFGKVKIADFARDFAAAFNNVS
jgi:uncharacterized protein YbjT (DUF2867 family)